MRKWLAWLITAFYLAMSAIAWAQPQIPPAPTNSIYVQDYAGVINADTKARINNLSSQLAAKTKAQVVVVTIKTLEGQPIDEYALEMLRQWGIGDKTLNNGVLLLVAVNDRKSRIEVGYGLEGALPDAKTGRIQDEYMIPYFQSGHYDQGILNGYLATVNEVAKEYQLELMTDARPVQRTHTVSQGASWWDLLPWWVHIAVLAGVAILFGIDWLFFGGMFTLLILSLFRGRGGGGGWGGGGGGGGFGGGSGGGGGSSRDW